MEWVTEKHGRIDILVNNIGNNKASDPATMSEQDWHAQTHLNSNTVYFSCCAVLPIMEKQGSGSIINYASIASMSYLGKPQVTYASTKAAVIQFAEVTGIMCSAKGVRINSISEVMMYTPLLEQLGNSTSEDRENNRNITDHNVPAGGMGDAFIVAHLVAFLASNISRYITSEDLIVGGGLTFSTGTGRSLRSNDSTFMTNVMNRNPSR